MSRLMTIAELRQLLGDAVSPSHLRRLAPKIPGSRKTRGGHWRFFRCPALYQSIRDQLSYLADRARNRGNRRMETAVRSGYERLKREPAAADSDETLLFMRIAARQVRELSVKANTVTNREAPNLISTASELAAEAEKLVQALRSRPGAIAQNAAASVSLTILR